ncbi:Ras GTPase-activating protein nGAP, partial [Quaeritorhiza haematococci]
DIPPCKSRLRLLFFCNNGKGNSFTEIGYVSIHLNALKTGKKVDEWVTINPFSTEQSLPAEVQEEFLEILLEPSLTCFIQMGDILGQQREEFAKRVINILIAKNRDVDGIKTLVTHEVLSTDDPNIIFRGNSVATKAMDQYMKLVGMDYLHGTLSNLIRNLYETNESCEPKLFGLTGEHPDSNTARTLTLIAKIIQNLANLSEFEGKEAYMTVCNSFISSQLPNMKQFIDQISTARNATSPPCPKPRINLKRETAVIAQYFCDHILEVRQRAAAAPDDSPPRRLLPVLAQMDPLKNTSQVELPDMRPRNTSAASTSESQTYGLRKSSTVDTMTDPQLLSKVLRKPSIDDPSGPIISLSSEPAPYMEASSLSTPSALLMNSMASTLPDFENALAAAVQYETPSEGVSFAEGGMLPDSQNRSSPLRANSDKRDNTVLSPVGSVGSAFPLILVRSNSKSKRSVKKASSETNAGASSTTTGAGSGALKASTQGGSYEDLKQLATSLIDPAPTSGTGFFRQTSTSKDDSGGNSTSNTSSTGERTSTSSRLKKVLSDDVLRKRRSAVEPTQQQGQDRKASQDTGGNEVVPVPPSPSSRVPRNNIEAAELLAQLFAPDPPSGTGQTTPSRNASEERLDANNTRKLSEVPSGTTAEDRFGNIKKVSGGSSSKQSLTPTESSEQAAATGVSTTSPPSKPKISKKFSVSEQSLNDNKQTSSQLSDGGSASGTPSRGLFRRKQSNDRRGSSSGQGGVEPLRISINDKQCSEKDKKGKKLPSPISTGANGSKGFLKSFMRGKSKDALASPVRETAPLNNSSSSTDVLSPQPPQSPPTSSSNANNKANNRLSKFNFGSWSGLHVGGKNGVAPDAAAAGGGNRIARDSVRKKSASAHKLETSGLMIPQEPVPPVPPLGNSKGSNGMSVAAAARRRGSLQDDSTMQRDASDDSKLLGTSVPLKSKGGYDMYASSMPASSFLGGF